MSESSLSSRPTTGPEASSIESIQSLLQAKDDTKRFVGLALIKALLDNSEQMRTNEAIVVELWNSISGTFLDRLLRTGALAQGGEDRGDAKHMLDLGVSILQKFAALLPKQTRRDAKLIRRIPRLVTCLGQSSDETARLALETLLGLVGSSEGAKALVYVDGLGSLIQLAPSQPLVLEVLAHAWTTFLSEGQLDLDGQGRLSPFDRTMEMLIGSFSEHHKGFMISFTSSFLRSIDIAAGTRTSLLRDFLFCPEWPSWLRILVQHIRDLFLTKAIHDVFADPDAAASCAPYINLLATLLQVFPNRVDMGTISGPAKASSKQTNDDSCKPFAYVIISLLLVDLRASLPGLLERLNHPSYPSISARLAATFDILSSFIGYLGSFVDEASANLSVLPLDLSPDLLLRLRAAISDTLASTTQYLRDRWDAAHAGAMGLHPEARSAGDVITNDGTIRRTLAWFAKDSGEVPGAEDPLVLAAVRCLALWLRDDGGVKLAKESAGLMDFFIELYRAGGSASVDASGFQRPLLVALEGIFAATTQAGDLNDGDGYTGEGVDIFLQHDGWKALQRDLLDILQISASPSARVNTADALTRGVEILRSALLPIVRGALVNRPLGPRPEWATVVITRLVAWVDSEDVPPRSGDATEAGLQELELWTLTCELAMLLLEGVPPNVRRREYAHAGPILRRLARRLESRALELEERVKDVGALRGWAGEVAALAKELVRSSDCIGS